MTSDNRLSAETCIKAVSQSLVMGRKALHTELAVCLAIFHSAGSTSSHAKALVTDVYSKAGYDCLNTASRHYKTVNRRVNAAAALYEQITPTALAEMVGNATEQRMLTAISKGLDTYQFSCMDDVLEFCGRDNNRTRAETSSKEAAVDMIKFNVEHVHVELPATMSAGGLLRLAARIVNVARRKEQEDLKMEMAHVATASRLAGIGSGHSVH